MAHERALARYRRWYGRLVRLYPKPYRERFGEGMEQTFNDLCRERAAAGQRLGLFAVWMFIETFVGVMREMRHLMPFFAAVLTIAIGIAYAGAVVSHAIDRETSMRLLPYWLVVTILLGGVSVKAGKK